MTPSSPSTNDSDPSSNIPHLLESLRTQTKQLKELEAVVGTKKDSIQVRQKINLYSDISLQIVRQVHVQSSSKSSQFHHSVEFKDALAEYDVCSKSLEKKLRRHPEKGLRKKSKLKLDSDEGYEELMDSLHEEEQDELVQLLDSFHETDQNVDYRKWTTVGLLVGGGLLGAAIGGPIGGYAFYAGAGSLGACLGLGLGSGAFVGAGGSYGLKKFKSWAKKRKQRKEQAKKKKDR